MKLPIPTQPLETHTCRRCGRSAFSVEVTVSSMGKEDFWEECIENDMTDEFTEDDRVNAFGWLGATPLCADCHKKEKHWLDAETAQPYPHAKNDRRTYRFQVSAAVF